MNLYEVMLVLNPALTPEATDGLMGVVKEVVGAAGGSIVKSDDWGERRLAFILNKHTQGRYFLVYASTTADSVKELDRRLRLREEVIRFMTVRRPDDYFELQKARQDRIATKKAEAEARAKLKAEAEAAVRAEIAARTAAAAPPAAVAPPAAAPAPAADPAPAAAPQEEAHGEPAVTQ